MTVQYVDESIHGNHLSVPSVHWICIYNLYYQFPARLIHRHRFARGPRGHGGQIGSYPLRRTTAPRKRSAVGFCSKTTGAHFGSAPGRLHCNLPRPRRSPEGGGTNSVGAPCVAAQVAQGFLLGSFLALTPREYATTGSGLSLSAHQLGKGRGRGRRRFTCGRGYAGAQVASSRCSVAKLGFELRVLYNLAGRGKAGWFLGFGPGLDGS